MLVSIIITNRNYGEYIGQAIDSALNQTYTPIEVIVVDDGSEDDSREIIAGFGTKVRSIHKEWQGQCSCFNAGFAKSSGDLVIFLDADDMLMPDAVAHHVSSHSNPAVMKSSGYLDPVNASGFSIGGRIPKRLFPSGDYKAHFIERGPGPIARRLPPAMPGPGGFSSKCCPCPMMIRSAQMATLRRSTASSATSKAFTARLPVIESMAGTRVRGLSRMRVNTCVGASKDGSTGENSRRGGPSALASTWMPTPGLIGTRESF